MSKNKAAPSLARPCWLPPHRPLLLHPYLLVCIAWSMKQTDLFVFFLKQQTDLFPFPQNKQICLLGFFCKILASRYPIEDQWWFPDK